MSSTLPNYLKDPAVISQLKTFLLEDLGFETWPETPHALFEADKSAVLLDQDLKATATLIVREPCVLAGLFVIKPLFELTGASIEAQINYQDGDQVAADTVILSLTGAARHIVTLERTLINIIQTLSATATATHHLSQLIEDTDCTLLDTRKTLPGLRLLQKYAVLLGGGGNHRIGLFDAVMLKENHIAVLGSIEKAVTKSISLNPDTPVIVEVESLEELKVALQTKAHRILVDNFAPDLLREAVAIRHQINPDMPLEASGNIDEKTIREVALTGVDFISSGSITKHVRAVDFSLRVSYKQ